MTTMTTKITTVTAAIASYMQTLRQQHVRLTPIVDMNSQPTTSSCAGGAIAGMFRGGVTTAASAFGSRGTRGKYCSI